MWEFVFRWETVYYLMLFLYVPSCIGLIVIVLLQKGKGVGFAGAFGIGGGSETVFGPRMSKTLPQKLTYTMAALFMVLALFISLIMGRLGKGVAPAKETEAPITDVSGIEGLGANTTQDIVPEPGQPAAPATTTAPEEPAAPATSTPPAAATAPAKPEPATAPSTPAEPAAREAAKAPEKPAAAEAPAAPSTPQ